MPPLSQNRRFAIVAAIAFAAFFAVDAYLFAGGGFGRAFGRATQEGQVLSKIARAARQAEVADVIFFGSSYVRSGIAGEPFLERGLLPFNFAVSGGAQVYDYFALKRIAPALQARADKPVLVVEIKSDVLPRTRNSAWSEYPQYIAIVRSRGEMLRHAPALWRNFRDFGMASQFISSLVVPSSIYRAHAVPMLGADASLAGSFYGAEDFSGFSPLYTIAVPRMVPDVPALPPAPIDGLWPGKVEFLREFLALAASTGCRVVLYQSPSVLMGRDAAVLDELVAGVQREFLGVDVIRTSDYRLDISDFDEGGHPNISGSDKMARYLIDRLGLAGSRERLAGKLAHGFDAAQLPVAWTTDAGRASVAGGEVTVRPGDVVSPMLAESSPINVAAGREWTLELALPGLRGRALVSVAWVDPASGAEQSASAVTPTEAEFLQGSARLFIRATPTADRVVIRIQDFATSPLVSGGFRVLRLWSNR